MPRQLRGPFEKATSQHSSAFDSGCNQRSGRNSCGREKICSEKWTNRGLWLTTVCDVVNRANNSRRGNNEHHQVR